MAWSDFGRRADESDRREEFETLAFSVSFFDGLHMSIRVELGVVAVRPGARTIYWQPTCDTKCKSMSFRQAIEKSVLRRSTLCLLCVGLGWLRLTPALGESKKSQLAVVTGPQSDAVSASNPSSGYTIGPADVLQINVWKEPEASVTATVVRSDGVISLPLIREVPVAGLTTRELEELLKQKFAQYIRNADVTVVVKEIHSQKIYLVGAVKKEGPIPLQTPLTVLQAISEGGGLTDYAKRNKIYLLRQESAKQVRIPFDYPAVIKGQRTEQNILMRPGDTIVVPQ